jgi:hypothetical protein
MKIVEKGDFTDPKTQMVVETPDENAPGKKKWPKGSLLAKMKRTWPELHKGVKYGMKLPLNIAVHVKDWVLCILHMNLRIVHVPWAICSSTR